MKLFRFLFGIARGRIVLAAIAAMLGGGANAAMVALVYDLIGDPTPSVLRTYIVLGLGLLVGRVICEMYIVRVGEDGALHLRTQLSAQIVRTRLRKLEELGIAKLLATLTADVQAIVSTLTMLPVLLSAATTIVAILVYLGFLSWKVLLATLGFIVLGTFTVQIPAIWAQRHFGAARDYEDDLYRHLEGVTSGAKELKIHARRREEFLTLDLAATAALRRDRVLAGQRILATVNSWGTLLIFVGIAVLAVPGVQYGVIPSAAVTKIALVFLYLLSPMTAVFTFLPFISQGVIAYERIEQIGISLDRAETKAPLEVAAASWSRIALRGVSQTYRASDGTSFRLGPLDFTLERGEIVFVVGGNGSGKSTLAKVITGLYPPESGSVELDGVPITDQSREAYSQHFSVVFSDFHLFDRLRGIDSAGLDARAAEYLRLLDIHHKVRLEDGVWSTTELSTGQRKRLALVIAYLEDRPIYLFDEWAADQDPTFKAVFYEKLLPELVAKGKTVIAITHDDRYFSVAHRIVRLDMGQIVDPSRREGTPRATMPPDPGKALDLG